MSYGTPPIVVELVVAVAENGVIGRDGKLPWRMPTDLRRFRALTLGKPVVMGRRTFASLKGPLDRRCNVVVTTDRGFAPAGVLVAHSIEEALERAAGAAHASGVGEVAVIGGAKIYAAALEFVDRVHLTIVHAAPDGDTSMPPFPAEHWREVNRVRQAAGPGDDHDMSFVELVRRSRPPAS
ncbi:MAG: dihydrofolate reductase [Rhizobiales bacterium]|nr:dihydrofolate reductase [Hyphomicrobiales bacterium]